MKNTSEYVVQTLIDDEDMSADLASLYPAASKNRRRSRGIHRQSGPDHRKEGADGHACRNCREMH